jgi:Protein of unknown function (DUF3311)
MKAIHLLAVVPIICMLAGPMMHNQVEPLILGMPFPLGWIAVWIVLTAAAMGLLYLIDPANRR